MSSSFKLGISPGAGEGHGEAVFGTTLCGVDWADDGKLVGWGGPPNKSPRRSVVAAAVDGGWLTVSPSRPRRSTSSGGARAAGGSGLWGGPLALLRWLERESISSSEGSLSSPWPRPSGPPWGRLGSTGRWGKRQKRNVVNYKMRKRDAQWRKRVEEITKQGINWGKADRNTE